MRQPYLHIGRGADRTVLNCTPRPERRGALHLLAVDFSLGLQPVVYRSVLRACAPSVLLVQNSGLELERYPASEKWDSFSSSSEAAPDSWHHFEEYLYDRSKRKAGCFRLVVDRALSNFSADVKHFSRDPPRRFSVYARVTPCDASDFYIGGGQDAGRCHHSMHAQIRPKLINQASSISSTAGFSAACEGSSSAANRTFLNQALNEVGRQRQEEFTD